MSINLPSDKSESELNTNRSGNHSLIQPQYMYHRFLAFLRTFFRAAYRSVQLPNSGMDCADKVVPSSTVFPGLYLFEITNFASFQTQRVQNPVKATTNALVPSAIKEDGDELSMDTIIPTVSATTFPNAHDLRFEGNPQFNTNSVNNNVRNENNWSFISIKDSPLSFLTVIVSIALVSLILIPGIQQTDPDGRDPPYGTSVLKDRLEPFISRAAINASIEQPRREVYPGTRKRVINQIKAWIDNPSAPERILWLYGPAGAGKSAIAQEIVNAYTREKIPATFFFFRSDSNRNDGNRLFTTLAWQFAFSVSRVWSHIVHSLNQDPDLGRKNVETQFRQLIARPFETHSNSMDQTELSDMVVVIDGIDECVDRRLQEWILQVMGGVTTNTHVPLRFFITSRPEAHITETINPFKRHTLSIDLAACADADHDIEIYLRGKFYAIAMEQHLDPAVWPGTENISELVFKASGQFIYASTVIEFLNDDDHTAQYQLDIILNLKPHTTQPFAELDRLYIEVLEQPPNKEFLKTFLTLLFVPFMVVPFDRCDTICHYHHNQGYASLMNVPEEVLFRKLRKMRSLLKFYPDNVVPYHRSFLDFLQDPSRSGKYNVSKESAVKEYFGKAIHSLIQSASLAIEQHDSYFPVPKFIKVTGERLHRKDLQESIRPLLEFQDQLLNLPNFTIPRNECTIFHLMHDLLLHFSYNQILLGEVNEICGTDMPSALMQHRLEPPWKGMFDLINTLRHTDPEVIAMQVTSWSKAQNMIDLVDHIVNWEYISTIQNNADIARNAALLALKIYTRVPVLPRIFRSTTNLSISYPEHFSQPWATMQLFSNFLDHQYILSTLEGLEEAKLTNFITITIDLDDGIPMPHLRKSGFNLDCGIISAMLSLARSIQYLHSMGIVLKDHISLYDIRVDGRFRVRIPATELMWWIPRDSLHQRYKRDISTFSYFFCLMYFDIKEYLCPDFISGSPDELGPRSISVEVRHLIQQCRSDNGKPTIDEVVREMESWRLDPNEVAKEMESWNVVLGDIFQNEDTYINGTQKVSYQVGASCLKMEPEGDD